MSDHLDDVVSANATPLVGNDVRSFTSPLRRAADLSAEAALWRNHALVSLLILITFIVGGELINGRAPFLAVLIVSLIVAIETLLWIIRDRQHRDALAEAVIDARKTFDTAPRLR